MHRISSHMIASSLQNSVPWENPALFDVVKMTPQGLRDVEMAQISECHECVCSNLMQLKGTRSLCSLWLCDTFPGSPRHSYMTCFSISRGSAVLLQHSPKIR